MDDDAPPEGNMTADDDVTVLVLQMPNGDSSGRAAQARSQGRTGRGRGHG